MADGGGKVARTCEKHGWLIFSLVFSAIALAILLVEVVSSHRAKNKGQKDFNPAGFMALFLSLLILTAISFAAGVIHLLFLLLRRASSPEGGSA
ncbi:hypothetical protein Nepgr_027600 [Nepenthes gracilis]|uniref:Uncharacterized protein n=1 Tax=Nepenthes gracilis TaxID=150966 RepID=A0AAD3TC07_NEPGR|nr:hypothetical protein Nepgr_027600 [Nepenthes gracilis]